MLKICVQIDCYLHDNVSGHCQKGLGTSALKYCNGISIVLTLRIVLYYLLDYIGVDQVFTFLRPYCMPRAGDDEFC